MKSVCNASFLFMCWQKEGRVKSSGPRSTLNLLLNLENDLPSFNNMTSKGKNITWACFMARPMLYNVENSAQSVDLSSLRVINLCQSCKSQIVRHHVCLKWRCIYSRIVITVGRSIGKLMVSVGKRTQPMAV